MNRIRLNAAASPWPVVLHVLMYRSVPRPLYFGKLFPKYPVRFFPKQVRAQLPLCASTYAHTLKCTHRHTDTLSRLHAPPPHTHTHTQTHTHTHAHTHTHKQTNKQTHTNTHTHAHTHTHTQTHTHTRDCAVSYTHLTLPTSGRV